MHENSDFTKRADGNCIWSLSVMTYVMCLATVKYTGFNPYREHQCWGTRVPTKRKQSIQASLLTFVNSHHQVANISKLSSSPQCFGGAAQSAIAVQWSRHYITDPESYIYIHQHYFCPSLYRIHSDTMHVCTRFLGGGGRTNQGSN